MPEIMSAKEFSRKFYPIYSKYIEDCFAKIVSDRDTAIIEKCKEAIIKAEACSKKMQLCSGDAIKALDSVLSEINGGK